MKEYARRLPSGGSRGGGIIIGGTCSPTLESLSLKGQLAEYPGKKGKSSSVAPGQETIKRRILLHSALYTCTLVHPCVPLCTPFVTKFILLCTPTHPCNLLCIFADVVGQSSSIYLPYSLTVQNYNTHTVHTVPVYEHRIELSFVKMHEDFIKMRHKNEELEMIPLHYLYIPLWVRTRRW